MPSPSVSVIVPVYKALERLPRCVQSVLSQTMKDFELVLIDDGSPDASGMLCDAFAMADKRVRVIHQRNGGVSAARNAGLKAAVGQWVVFLDADDAMSPLALETALLVQQQNPDRMIMWTYISQRGGTFATAVDTDGEPFEPSFTAQLYLQAFLSMPWNKLFCRRTIEAHTLFFDLNYSLGEDLLFCLDYYKAFLAGDGQGVFFLNSPLTLYDTSDNPNSLTQRYRSDFYPLWSQLYSRLLADCEQTFGCSERDIALVHASFFSVIASGIVDLLARGEGSHFRRRQTARTILKQPQNKRSREAAKKGKVFSLFSPAFWLHSPRLVRYIYSLRWNKPTVYYKLQGIGQSFYNRL